MKTGQLFTHGVGSAYPVRAPSQYMRNAFPKFKQLNHLSTAHVDLYYYLLARSHENMPPGQDFDAP